MSAGPHEGALYRYQNPDGTSKDWAIGDGGDGNIYVYFGKTGKKLRVAVIPPARFAKRTLAEEIERRIEEQTRDGYQYISRARIIDGLVTSVTTDPALAPIEWDMTQKIDLDQLRLKLHEIAAALGDNPYPGLAMTLTEDAILLKNGNRSWQFGVSESLDGGIKRSTGRGGGRVLPEHGPIPLLVLMSIAASFPGTFVFGDDTGNTVSLRLSEDEPRFAPNRVVFSKVRAAAAKLGIVAPSLSELNVRSTGVWF